jgi:16S rRNA (uracil1498-N3)-methyltransferase
MYLFYTPQIDGTADEIGKTYSLDEEESGHCVRVLRYTRGDEILLTNGQGMTYTAVITNPHPKHCEFEVRTAEKQSKHHSNYIHIAIAPTKNVERIEWFVEKCTEIGVDEITPLLCRFSERKQLRIDRLQKIILSAAKQSLTPYLPKLNEMTDCTEFIRRTEEETRFIAHCYKEDKRDLRNEIKPGKSVVVMIGPEGDFSEQEIAEALQHNFVPVSLGDSRLRTETAGIVACHICNLFSN